MFCRAMHHSELLLLLLVKRPSESLAQDASKAQDRVERGAQLVAHGGEELALEAVEFQKTDVGVLEFLSSLSHLDLERVVRFPQGPSGAAMLPKLKADRQQVC